MFIRHIHHKIWTVPFLCTCRASSLITVGGRLWAKYCLFNPFYLLVFFTVFLLTRNYFFSIWQKCNYSSELGLICLLFSWDFLWLFCLLLFSKGKSSFHCHLTVQFKLLFYLGLLKSEHEHEQWQSKSWNRCLTKIFFCETRFFFSRTSKHEQKQMCVCMV